MLPDSVKDWYVDLVNPATQFLARRRIQPNLLTTAGFLINTLAAVSIFRGSLVLGGILVLAGGTFDIFDGRVARATVSGDQAMGRASPLSHRAIWSA